MTLWHSAIVSWITRKDVTKNTKITRKMVVPTYCDLQKNKINKYQIILTNNTQRTSGLAVVSRITNNTPVSTQLLHT